jgi:hypothetical protein
LETVENGLGGKRFPTIFRRNSAVITVPIAAPPRGIANLLE